MFDKMIYAPFVGIKPVEEFAGRVVAPPYDVLSSSEAKVKVKGNPYSFLHISKAEIDLDEGISCYDDKVYEKARDNFNVLLENGVLTCSNKPCFYVYQMVMGEHKQTGFAVGASIKAYDEGRIKRHELTRVVKENDRVRQIRTVGAQTGPVLLINKVIPEIKEFLKKVESERKPLFSVIGDYDVRHTVWEISDDAEIEFIAKAFNEQNEAYIADGHHRSAAATRLAKEDGNVENGRFLAMAFFEDEMKIWDYNRVVFDLNGNSVDEFMNKVKDEGFELKEADYHKPNCKGQFMMYINRKWFEMNYKGKAIGDDPVSKLDVSVLSNKVLDKILGIADLRNSERIDFVGGIRGEKEVERMVDEADGRVGFMLYPTGVDELLAVADMKMLMPPKSTWFEPKLADGLLSLKI